MERSLRAQLLRCPGGRCFALSTRDPEIETTLAQTPFFAAVLKEKKETGRPSARGGMRPFARTEETGATGAE